MDRISADEEDEKRMIYHTRLDSFGRIPHSHGHFPKRHGPCPRLHSSAISSLCRRACRWRMLSSASFLLTSHSALFPPYSLPHRLHVQLTFFISRLSFPCTAVSLFSHFSELSIIMKFISIPENHLANAIA